MSNQHLQYENEIDLKNIFLILYQKIFSIIFITIALTLIFGLIAYKIPEQYSASVLLKVNDDPSKKQSFSGLASFAGISLNDSGSSKSDIFIETVKSKLIINEILNNYPSLKKDIIAVKGYDFESKKVLYDIDLYDENKDKWVRKTSKGRNSEPSYIEVHEYLQDKLYVDENKETGFITLSYNHYSPDFAFKFINILVDTVNQITKKNDVEGSNKALIYLYDQLSTTSEKDIRSSINNLILDQLNINMLANVNENYIVTPVDPAVIPETNSSPNKILIIIVGFMLGLFLSISVAFVRQLYY